MSEIGSVIHNRRKERGFTLRKLADLAGVCPSAIGRIERGERNPSAGILKKLAKPLKLTEVGLLKAVGYLSGDDSDEHLEQLRVAILSELDTLRERIDALFVQEGGTDR